MQFLREHGAPLPRVLAASSGETAIESGEWTYEVHEVPEGLDLYEEALSWTPFRSAAHARSAGEALARLHLASQGFDAPRAQGAASGGKLYDICGGGSGCGDGALSGGAACAGRG